MRPYVTDRGAWFVGLSVTLVSPAKTAEVIEMLFGLWTRMDPGKHVLDGGPDLPMGRGNFEGGRCVPLHSILGHVSAVSCAKMAEPIEIPFGL